MKWFSEKCISCLRSSLVYFVWLFLLAPLSKLTISCLWHIVFLSGFYLLVIFKVVYQWVSHLIIYRGIYVSMWSKGHLLSFKVSPLPYLVLCCAVTLVLSDAATLWTIAHKTPLSMGFSWQEYWSGLLCSPPGSLLDPGIEPMSLMRPALASGFFTISILLGKYAQFPVVYVNNMYFMHSYQFCMTDCSLIWRLVRTKRNSTREFGDETQRGKHEVTSWRKKKELHAIWEKQVL